MFNIHIFIGLIFILLGTMLLLSKNKRDFDTFEKTLTTDEEKLTKWVGGNLFFIGVLWIGLTVWANEIGLSGVLFVLMPMTALLWTVVIVLGSRKYSI